MILTSEQMKIVEAKSVELGMSWLRLMENAGSAAARIMRNSFELAHTRVTVICGKGNNGGDGYVIARKLLDDGAAVKVISIGSPSTPSCVEMASKAYNLGIRPVDFESYGDICRQYIKETDIIVDAMFGTGFKGVASGTYADIISAVNDSAAVKLAIDVPSGMCTDKYEPDAIFAKADKTVAFAAYKPCHLLFPSSKYCGEVTVAPIGMPDEAFAEVEPTARIVSDQTVAKALPERASDAHKGDSGTAALYCGCKGYSGAAVIAAKAAVKSGAGIVNAIIPESIYTIMGVSLPEAVCTVVPDVEPGETSQEVTDRIVTTINKSTVGLVGCGLGRSEQARKTVTEILKSGKVPLVLDADGINLAADCIDLIRQYEGEVVITPHPKEASRLLGCEVADIQNDRLGAAKRLVAVTGAVSVLKGANTVIALPDGSCYTVTDGNPGMATAGTGDMLAGMVAAFIAQGMSTADAAVSAVKLHAVSGDTAVRTSSVLSLTPTDMINALPAVFCRMYSLK